MLYRSLILPIFEYCDFIFDCLSQKNAIMLECFKNSAIGNIMGYNRMDSATKMRTESNQDSLSLRRSAHCMNEMYKVINKMAPPELQSLFKFKTSDSGMSLRSESRKDLEIPSCKLECSKRNFTSRGSLNWNKLPVPSRSIGTLASFIKAVYEYLRTITNV